jgi:hypothetical protein
MIDSQGVTVFDSIQELQENPLGQNVVSDKITMLCDVGEEITFRAKFNDDISAVDSMQDFDQVDHIWMCASAVVQGDFSFLESALSCIESDLWKGLDSIWDVSKGVDCSVDDTICTNTQDAGKFYSTSEQMAYSILWSSGKGNLRV